MTPADTEAAATILADAGLCPRQDAADRIRFCVNLPNQCCLVAENAGEVIGVVLATYNGFHFFLSHIAVVESQRRRGVGTTLHVDLLERATNRGARGIIADAWTSAEGFFRKLGYRMPAAVFMIRDVK